MTSRDCSGKCELCWGRERKLTPATHAVTEVVFEDDKDKNRKPLTRCLCEKHFNSIFK